MFENPALVKSSLSGSLAGQKILVVGDIMLDRYITGAVARISPEAPVPVVKVERRYDRLGGAANLAANFSHLGFDVDLAGALGVDAPADAILLLCRDEKIGLSCIRPDGYRTVTKTRVIGEHQQIVRLDDEDPHSIGREAGTMLSERISEAFQAANYQAVVLSDYAKGVCDEGVCQSVVESAKRYGIPVFVDPKGYEYEKYRGSDFIKPNRAEISEIARRHAWNVAEPLSCAAQLRELLDLAAVVLTLGGQGISIVRENHVTTGAAVAREVFDVSGAGDTVMASLVAGVLFGLSDHDLVALCNLAAAQVVGKIGSTPIDLGELALEVRRVTSSAGHEKLHTLDDLMAAVGSWRRQGLKVGFTNGCFDLLHAGHIRLFETAAASCDRLIVAINSDSSVQKNKGSSRPFMREADRVAVLCALQAVDAVIVFDAETPDSLIRAVVPDVLVKGSDYAGAVVVGADLVTANGGQVLLVPILEGISTSKLADALAKL